METSAEESITERVRTICLAIPDTLEKLSHGEPMFFVKGKSFANMDTNHHSSGHIAIWCAAAPGAQETLVDANPRRFFRPPYVGIRGWLGVRLDDDDVDWEEIEAILAEAAAIIRPVPKGRAGVT